MMKMRKYKSLHTLFTQRKTIKSILHDRIQYIEMKTLETKHNLSRKVQKIEKIY